MGPSVFLHLDEGQSTRKSRVCRVESPFRAPGSLLYESGQSNGQEPIPTVLFRPPSEMLSNLSVCRLPAFLVNVTVRIEVSIKTVHTLRSNTLFPYTFGAWRL